MKNKKLQTKRKPQKGFRAMYARTVGRKVRVSAAASAEELDGDVPSVGIGKALSVILILHVLAIAAIYVGTQWKGDDEESKSGAIALDNAKEEDIKIPGNENPGTVYLGDPASYELNGNTSSGHDINDGSSLNKGLSVEPRRREPRVIKPRRDPNKPKAMRASNPKYSATKVTEYEIQKGDNFYRLAKRYKIKQQELLNMNPEVNARKMRVGTVIKIPQH